MIHLQSSTYTSNLMGDEIKKLFHKHFPHSYFDIDAEKESLTVKFALGKDKTEWSHGYVENDPMYNIVYIDGFVDGVAKDTLKTENLKKGWLFVAPKDTNNHGREKIVTWRANFSASPEKTISNLDKFFIKLHDTVKQNLDRLPPLAKSKI